MDKREDYILGRSVTKQARNRENRSTSVVSLRLSAAEMDVLFAMAEREGKTVSQVVRDAIRQMRFAKTTETHWAAVSYTDGRYFAFGTGRPLTIGCAESINIERHFDKEPVALAH